MFSFDKTIRPFSSVAPNQLHEQNNEVIKSFGGVTAFLSREDQSELERWSLCSSELASIVADYQKSSNTNFNVNMKHVDTTAFQKRFTLDVRKVVRSVVANPFQQDTLARIDNTTIQYDDKVLVNLKQFLDKGQEQAKQFWDKRFVKGTVPINAPVKKNNFSLPGKFEGRKEEEEQKLTYSSFVLTKLRSSIDIRPEITKRCFNLSCLVWHKVWWKQVPSFIMAQNEKFLNSSTLLNISIMILQNHQRW